MSVATAARTLRAKLKVDYIDETDKACGYATRRDGGDRGVSYMVEHGHIVRVDIDTPAIRTTRGIGIGATAAQVRKAYGAAVRGKHHAYTDGQYLEVRAPGGRFGLVFEIERGKVSTMRSGAWPAVGYIEGCA